MILFFFYKTYKDRAIEIHCQVVSASRGGSLQCQKLCPIYPSLYYEGVSNMAESGLFLSVTGHFNLLKSKSLCIYKTSRQWLLCVCICKKKRLGTIIPTTYLMCSVSLFF